MQKKIIQNLIKYSPKNKILFISSSRADYGIIRNLLLKLKNIPKFNVALLVMGDHLVVSKGNTIKEIIKDKIKIICKLKVSRKFYEENSKTIVSLQKSIRHNIIKFKPDLVILLGDRKEILLSALTCFFLNIKIIHISGGEKTIGSKDDIHRHLISKFSDFHFVSELEYKKRLVQLGEDKKKIYVIGSLASENIKNSKFKSKNYIEKKYGFKFLKDNALITFHPDTSKKIYSGKDFDILLKSLKSFPNLLKIFNYPNADSGSDIIIEKIYKFKKNNKNVIVIKSFGQEDYFSTLKYIDFYIGNSSSGITELPLFKKTTINLGDRQNGRLFSSTIINSKFIVSDIVNNISIVLKSDYKTPLNKIYFNSKNATLNAIKNIKNVININKSIKIFTDL